MKIIRQKEVVESYRYQTYQEEELATDISVSLQPLDVPEENQEQLELPTENHSILGIRVTFRIVFDEFFLDGSVSQVVSVAERTIKTAEDCTPDELDELIRPLFAIIERLTYEVTEIALDQPGIQLNFENKSEKSPEEEN